MKKDLFYILLLVVYATTLFSCDLTEEPKATAGRSMIFGTESGLKAYSYSFYDMLPDYNTAFKLDDLAADYMIKNDIGVYESGSFTVNTEKSWSWSELRNINYFLKHNVGDGVPANVRDNYNGIARFFRAYFYFTKLISYGELPWIDQLIASDDAEVLYAGRDSRDVIINKIIEDLDFAFNNIQENKATVNSNLINKWSAAFLKSRVCLFEASWRKYHAGTDYVANCTISYDDLFKLAAQAAYDVMESRVYDIYDAKPYANGRGSYRELFISDNAIVKEVMLACSTDQELQMGEQNWWYNSSSYGPHPSMSRNFMKTYLNQDGSFYEEKNPDGSYKTFAEETVGRDTRLNQTIMCFDYTRKNSEGTFVPTLPNYTGHSLSGYQFTKYVLDDVAYDDGRKNINDIPIFRYAEVLLNYAEAKAELGTITDDDWKNTIGKLRKRAGITGGLENLPQTIDSYLQSTYFPNVSNPILLEIRRERAIELCLEGSRLRDMKRWACGDLWVKDDWKGIYIPSLDTPLDINQDGIYDLYVTRTSNYKGEYADIAVILGAALTVKQIEDDPNHGYFYWYNTPSRVWNANMYLYPIPQEVRNVNSNLSQNPGW